MDIWLHISLFCREIYLFVCILKNLISVFSYCYGGVVNVSRKI